MPTATASIPMLQMLRRRLAVLSAVAVLLAIGGCGTTRLSDSKRTATEQLLVSGAIERAVMRIDMQSMAGQSVYLDATCMDDVNDGKYLASALRHQLLASGCRLVEKREDAQVIVESRAGAIGTDRNQVVLGIPSTRVTVQGNETSVPELAIAKRSEQRGVVRISLCAYERETGRPLWQSGVENVASHSRDRWYFGAGPFQDGEIHDGPEFAGRPAKSLFAKDQPEEPAQTVAGIIDLSKPHIFAASPAGTGPMANRPVVADHRTVDLTPVR